LTNVNLYQFGHSTILSTTTNHVTVQTYRKSCTSVEGTVKCYTVWQINSTDSQKLDALLSHSLTVE